MNNGIGNIFKGFTFGISLQLAIGPVCLFILNVAARKGFQNAEFGVIGVTIIDALYIVLALYGISKFIKNGKTKEIIEYLGISILFVFGIKMILDSCFNLNIQENHSEIIGQNLNTFSTALLLTASSPLTILIWTGIFSARINQEKDNNTKLFAFGCIISTFVFLSLVSALGSVMRIILPNAIIGILNGLVGLAFIGYTLKKFIKIQKARKLKSIAG